MLALNVYAKLNAHSQQEGRIHLIEFGPGRGTLMRDMLRTLAQLPSFVGRVEKCTFVEVSPRLTELQASSVAGLGVKPAFSWVSDVDDVVVAGTIDLLVSSDAAMPDDEIPVFIAQEFFDALPIHVFKVHALLKARRGFKKQKSLGGWREILVSASRSEQRLCLVEESTSAVQQYRVDQSFASLAEGQTVEISPESWKVCHQMRRVLDRCGRGEGIIVDYGRFGPSHSTLRVGSSRVVLVVYIEFTV